MLRNFHLAALTKKRGRSQLFHIPLHQSLQDSLAEMWYQQYDDFMQEIDEIEFDAGYMPEEHERFCLQDYELPDELNGESSLSIHKAESISAQDDLLESIKAIVGYARDNKNHELVLFQNFNRSHVIRPGVSLFLRDDVYKSFKRPGLTLDDKLAAVYLPKNKRLLFSNFRITNTFIPLADIYKEASEHEIRAVLNHDLFAPEDMEALVTDANQWFRKRIAMLRDSGNLDDLTPQKIKELSKGYDVKIKIDHASGKIVFPSERKAAKKLLQFLNEEIFHGAITERLYETNSKRAAD